MKKYCSPGHSTGVFLASLIKTLRKSFKFIIRGKIEVGDFCIVETCIIIMQNSVKEEEQFSVKKTVNAYKKSNC